ncbi:MAG: hypothetical protein KDD66_07110, partial [Bdellovibrionales bacterium]|nr:hypothetical protein [Bdellovibrionales bacterium]
MSVTGGAQARKTEVRPTVMNEDGARDEGFTFAERHVGPSASEVQEMLKLLGLSTLEELVSKTVPAAIRTKRPLAVGEAMSEGQALDHLRAVASKNQIFRSLIGMGYYGTFTP